MALMNHSSSVVAPLELVGTGIGDVLAVLVDDAEVDEKLGAGLDDGQKAFQVVLFRQLRVGMGIGDGDELRGAFG